LVLVKTMEETGIYHIVSSGEWLQSICREYLVRDPMRVWDHGENATLKKTRRPEELHPGDMPYIPPVEQKMETCADKARHSFTVKSFTEDFTLMLEEPDGSPMKNMKYRLVLGDYEFLASTDGAGKIEHKKLVLRSGTRGVLEVPDRALRYPIALGALNPGDKTEGQEHNFDNGLSGIRQRLNNLGYDAGSSSGSANEVGLTADDPLYEALAAFQREVMVRDDEKATGELDDETRQAVIDEFGT